MVNKPTKSKLRILAEAKVKKAFATMENQSPEKTKMLLHELEVYHVELEMQNEELRETQIRLEEAIDQYTDLFDFSPIGYVSLDEKGIVKNINLTACMLLGTERAHIKDWHFSAFMSRSESDKLFLVLQEAFKTGVVPSFELRLTPISRNNFEALFHGAFNTIGDRTNSVCHLSLQDMTKLRKAENLERQYENLQKEKENIQQYLDLAPIIFLLIDTEYNVQMINQRGCDILGYSRLEIQGRNWFENFIILAGNDQIDTTPIDFAYKKLLLNPYFECNVKKKNGGQQLVGWTNTSLLDKFGNLIGTLSAGVNINRQNS